MVGLVSSCIEHTQGDSESLVPPVHHSECSLILTHQKTENIYQIAKNLI